MNSPPPKLLHHPTLKEDSRAEGLICFLDKSRPCNPDCMAFLPQPPEGPDYQDQQWASCMLLVNANRVGKHLIVLAAQGGERLKSVKNAAADAARANQPPPPTVK